MMRFVICVLAALAMVGCGSSQEHTGGGGTSGSGGGTATPTPTPAPLDTNPGTPSNALDGRTFTGPMTQPGSSEAPHPETIVFVNGTFESIECRQYGFTATPYSTRVEGTTTAFHAVATSPAEGMMVWDGRVTGAHVSLGVVWRKPGQADIRYALEGEAPAPVGGSGAGPTAPPS